MATATATYPDSSVATSAASAQLPEGCEGAAGDLSRFHNHLLTFHQSFSNRRPEIVALA